MTTKSDYREFINTLGDGQPSLRWTPLHSGPVDERRAAHTGPGWGKDFFATVDVTDLKQFGCRTNGSSCFRMEYMKKKTAGQVNCVVARSPLESESF